MNPEPTLPEGIHFDLDNHAVLSNFWVHRVNFRDGGGLMIGDKIFPSAEHLYQSLKYIFEGCPDVNYDYAEVIMNQITPRRAQILGDQITAGVLDWDGSGKLIAEYRAKGLVCDPNWLDKRISLMEFVSDMKYDQDAYFRRVLMGTGSKRLFARSYGEFWGLNDRGEGKNALGEMLEKLRARKVETYNLDNEMEEVPKTLRQPVLPFDKVVKKRMSTHEMHETLHKMAEKAGLKHVQAGETLAKKAITVLEHLSNLATEELLKLDKVTDRPIASEIIAIVEQASADARNVTGTAIQEIFDIVKAGADQHSSSLELEHPWRNVSLPEIMELGKATLKKRQSDMPSESGQAAKRVDRPYIDPEYSDTLITHKTTPNPGNCATCQIHLKE